MSYQIVMSLNNKQEQNILVQWLTWHFYEMPKFLFLVWENYLLFGINYFSINLLFLTLFSPWKKYNWSYPKGFNVGEYFGTFISYIFSRIIGAICRTALIIIGIIVQVVIFVLGAMIILFWFLMPVTLILLVLLLLYGF